MGKPRHRGPLASADQCTLLILDLLEGTNGQLCCEWWKVTFPIDYWQMIQEILKWIGSDCLNQCIIVQMPIPDK